MDILIAVGAFRPFYKGNFSIMDFYTRYGVGMDAGARIGIAPFSSCGGKSRTVSVAGHNVCIVCLCP